MCQRMEDEARVLSAFFSDEGAGANITHEQVERIMRAATRLGDPDQGDLFLDYLREQDRLEECR